MKVYRTDRRGIDIWRLSGVVEMKDARALVHTLGELREPDRGCLILDFEKVERVDYRVFKVFEDWFPKRANVSLSGLSDCVLDTSAYLKKKKSIHIYPDWKKAFQYLMVERGKIGAPAATSSVGNK